MMRKRVLAQTPTVGVSLSETISQIKANIFKEQSVK